VGQPDALRLRGEAKEGAVGVERPALRLTGHVKQRFVGAEQ
jgi:hypothetical protein